MTTLQQMESGQNNAEVVFNEVVETMSAVAIYGKNHDTTPAGLVWGYYGGLYDGNTIANGTVTLADAADNWLVVERATGIVSVSTSNTNAVDTDYAAIYKITTAGGVVTALVDLRFDTNGLLLSGGGSGAGALSGLSDVAVTGSDAPVDGDVLTWDNASGKWVALAPDASGGTVTHTAGALTANALMVGNGTDDAKVLASLGTTSTVLHGDAAGPPTFGAVVTADLADDAVTYAKMQPVSATSRALGRKTAGAGDVEELTLSELLDFIGSAAQGDILYRGASAWARLAASTAGFHLKTNGSGQNPSWAAPPCVIAIACSDETTALTTGTNKVKFINPYSTALNVTAVVASLSTAQASGSIFTVDINEAGTTILSTKLTIDNTETNSSTAATAAVISDASIAAYAEFSVDIDQVGNGTAAGLKVYIHGYPS